jgi:mono/diheme cytochrome c family protein
MRRLILLLSIAAASLALSAASAEPEIDAFTGFPKTGDWELVRANCIACHSPRLITQQRGSSAQWLTLIRWMQEKQNLWAFEPEIEAKIVAWLAETYPPSEDRRRAAIPPDLMPPNPYAPATTGAAQ